MTAIRARPRPPPRVSLLSRVWVFVAVVVLTRLLCDCSGQVTVSDHGRTPNLRRKRRMTLYDFTRNWPVEAEGQPARAVTLPHDAMIQ